MRRHVPFMKAAQDAEKFSVTMVVWSYIEITTQKCAGALWLMERYLIIVMGFPYRQRSASRWQKENRVRLLFPELKLKNTSVIICTRTKNGNFAVWRINNNNEIYISHAAQWCIMWYFKDKRIKMNKKAIYMHRGVVLKCIKEDNIVNHIDNMTK